MWFLHVNAEWFCMIPQGFHMNKFFTLEATRWLKDQGQADKDLQQEFAGKDQVIEIGPEVLWLGIRRMSAGAFSGVVCWQDSERLP